MQVVGHAGTACSPLVQPNVDATWPVHGFGDTDGMLHRVPQLARLICR